MTNEELEYKAELYVAVEFHFLFGRYLHYCRYACIDGEERGLPQMSLDDYIKYEVSKYHDFIPADLKRFENAIFDDVIQYYDTLKNNPDIQREVHRRIYSAIIDDALQVQYDLAPEIKEIYGGTRYVITPFKSATVKTPQALTYKR